MKTIMKAIIITVLAIFFICPVSYGQGKIVRPQESNTARKTAEKKHSSTVNSKDAIINRLVGNMVFIEGGSFVMGTDDPDAFDWEKPSHEETVESFHIGKYEVTQKEWKAIMEESNPSFFIGDDLPVERVTWERCLQFIEKLNSLTGKNFRLPTEAEWEFAARGGIRSKGFRFSGSDKIEDVGWVKENSHGFTHKIGQKLPNELGLYDMSGNVNEWTSDQYCSDYRKPRSSSDKVYRGGCWTLPHPNGRVTNRSHDQSSYGDRNIGFRLAY